MAKFTKHITTIKWCKILSFEFTKAKGAVHLIPLTFIELRSNFSAEISYKNSM